MSTPLPGCRVKVSFGRRSVVGVVVGSSDSSTVSLQQLKPVSELLDVEPLIPEPLLQMYLWAARYYQHPIGDALLNMFPAALRESKPATSANKAWQLTTEGKGLPESALSRAPKQQALLNLLQEKALVDRELLSASGISAAIVRALRDKGLIEEVEITAVEPPHIKEPSPLLGEPALPLNEEQRAAVDDLPLQGFSCTLLQGETGSGKTEVYLQLIERIVSAGKQALVLIPEINLTPQTLGRFSRRFNCTIAAMHSGMTHKERLTAWHQARTGQARIVLGTRSALFTPLQQPGIIVVDEEHDSSFKQQSGFQYSARDLAVVRAKQEDTPIVLGSATPSLESLHNCQQGRYRKTVLKQRHGLAQKPQWQLVDLLNSQPATGLSTELISAIKKTLDDGNQAMIFLNRRGYAPRMSCRDCAWIAECNHCSARYTVHQRANRLICHHCEKSLLIPRQCPDCHSPRLSLSGQGTERVEETLETLFPDTPVYRIDRDTTRRKHAMQQLFEKINGGDPCILAGTQMLAKGHHFPDVTLVAMLDVDQGLFSPDFRAAEKMAQLITQVAGRCGRGDKPGKVLIQSQYCDHPLLKRLVEDGYEPFCADQSTIRQQGNLPPFSHLVIIRAESTSATECEQFLRAAKQAYGQLTDNLCIGPLPNILERKQGRFRYQLSLLDKDRQHLQQNLARLTTTLDSWQNRKVRWSIDVDPVDSM